VIRERDAGLRGRPVGLARDRHDAGHPLEEQVVTGPVPPGAGLAERRDGAVYEVLVVFAEGFIVDAQPFGGARPEVLDERVGVRDQVV
jgi:hypothetical protein